MTADFVYTSLDKNHRSRFLPWLKLAYSVIFVAFFIVGGSFLVKEYLRQKNLSLNRNLLVKTNYQLANWQDYGQVFEPIIKLPVYYPEKGYLPESFLLDSGALVSSLPKCSQLQAEASLPCPNMNAYLLP